jgi:uncharacterized protein YbjT (DUF2867 family)
VRILMTGATGMIGSALVERLREAGHELVLIVRDTDGAKARWPHVTVHRGTFSEEMPSWARHLQNVDVVINAVGLFTEEGSQTFDAVHVKGPLALFSAAAQAGVRRIIQISALGANPRRDEAYLASKGRADTLLAGLPVQSTIVRPSLVFAPEGPSTQWFAALAVLPLTPLPGSGEQRIQPVHLDDLCTAIVRLVDAAAPPAQLDVVGATAITLRVYLKILKGALGATGMFLPVPLTLLRRVARFVGRFSPWLAPGALSMLEAGSTAAPGPMTQILGYSPRAATEFVDETTRPILRMNAVLFWLRPVLRICLALMWLVTGYVSAFVYPVGASMDLLARTGLHGMTATLALYGAAGLDALLGLMLFVPPWRRLSYTLQLVLIAAYTVLISVFLPEYWAHPYGPILKNLPLLAAIAMARELDTPHGHHRR